MTGKARTQRVKYSKQSDIEMSGIDCRGYVRLQNESSDDKSTRRRTLKIYIYRSEMAKIKHWVLLHKNTETGGDLFGLWVNSHTAVVQFALGPGKSCKRYETSFFQDLDYLEKAGNLFTKMHGLCNIGQWHSHHQLSLAEPSAGDENTVWGHMPTLGLRRYIVCIANISKKARNVSVNCFLFELDDEGKQLPVLPGEFKILQQKSPVNEHLEIAEVIAEGAEPEEEKERSQESFCFQFRRDLSLDLRNLKNKMSPLPLKLIAAIIGTLVVAAALIAVIYRYS